MKNNGQRSMLNDKNPGNPPTPIEFAINPNPTEITAATDDPIIAAINGQLYFKFIPNIAGSVTPRYAEMIEGIDTCSSSVFPL